LYKLALIDFVSYYVDEAKSGGTWGQTGAKH